MLPTNKPDFNYYISGVCSVPMIIYCSNYVLNIRLQIPILFSAMLKYPAIQSFTAQMVSWNYLAFHVLKLCKRVCLLEF